MGTSAESVRQPSPSPPIRVLFPIFLAGFSGDQFADARDEFAEGGLGLMAILIGMIAGRLAGQIVRGTGARRLGGPIRISAAP